MNRAPSEEAAPKGTVPTQDRFEIIQLLKEIEMKTSKILAAAALSLLAVAGVAQAETYDGVLTVNSTLSRSEVASQGVVAARSENVAATAYGQGVQAPLVASAPRATIRTEAVAAAHDPLWNLDRKAFVNSTIPSQYKRTHMSFTRQAAL